MDLITMENATYQCQRAEKMQKLLDLLEDNDDVQEVYHNWESDEE